MIKDEMIYPSSSHYTGHGDSCFIMRRINPPDTNVVSKLVLFHRGCYGDSELTPELSEVDAVARAQSGRTTYGQTSEEIHKC